MSATRTLTHFSGFQYHAMFQFAKAAQENELELREAVTMSSVLGAIASSVAFLEALINEVFILAGEEIEPYRKLIARNAMSDLWDDVASRLSMLVKYDSVLALNNREGFQHGGRVYPDADALVNLRNAVVHHRTGVRHHPDPAPLEIEKLLAGKFPPSQFYANQSVEFFPHRCLGAGCAVWAVKAARTFADEFHAKLGANGHHSRIHGVPKLN